MGKCYSTKQPSRGNSEQQRHESQSQYRLLKIFSRNENGNCVRKRNREKKNVFLHGSADELAALQTSKADDIREDTSKDKPKSHNVYVSHDIDIYPVINKNAESDGKSGSHQDVAGYTAASQLTCQKILKGDMNTEISNLAKVVRIVVASVHEDMEDERLILERTLYPELSKFCRHHSYDLRIIDLDINDEKFKYKDWMEEIRTSHDESTGVGFMVFVGQNLGEKILPAKINMKDFELLSEKSQKIIEIYYEVLQDDSSETNFYILKQHENDENELAAFLMEEMDQSEFKTKSEQQYSFNALLQVAALGHEFANDVSSALWVERKQEERLEDGRKEEEIIEDGNIEVKIGKNRYSTKSKSSVISYEEFLKDTNKRDSFYQTILDTLKEKLQATMYKKELHSIADEDLKELAQHILICQENIANVSNAEEERVLDIHSDICSYLTKKNTKMPLVVHGSPGCGKSTIVSMAAKLASEKMVVDGSTTLIVRFLASTRHSSNLRLLLRSICFQLAKVQANKDTFTQLPQDFQSIVKMFHNLLHNVTKTKRVCIILDGLDQLPKDDLLWLPRKLPDHVSIVVTALTNGGCYNNLKAMVTDESHFIDVNDLLKPDARSYLTEWCRRRRVEPGDELSNRFLGAVFKSPNILYLKLLLHHYYQKLPLEDATDDVETHIASSLKHIIEHYFVTMEEKHGQSIIVSIMGYLSAARFGLSESELQNLLSQRNHKSDQATSSFTQPSSFHLSRILHDLSPFLFRVYFDGVLVLTWRHLIIRYLAFERYLSSRQHDAMVSIYQTLTNYFASNIQDDPLASLRRIHDLPYYLCKVGNVERLKHVALCNFNFLSEQLSGTCLDYVIECFTARHCPMDSDLKTIVDTLKLSSEALYIDPSQLAAQLIGRLSDLTSSDHISCLLNEARSSSLNALIPNTGCLNPPGTKLLHTSLDLYGPVDITSDSTLGLSATKNIIVLWDIRSGKTIRAATTESIVKQVRFCRHDRLFVSDNGSYLEIRETSTFKIVWRLECPGDVEDITIAGNGQDVLVAACGSAVKSWNMRNGQVMTEITEVSRLFDRVAGWREYIACASSTAKEVRVYDTVTSTFLTHIKAYEEDTKDLVSCVLLSSFGDGQVLTTSVSSFEIRVFRLSNGEWLRTIGPDIMNPALTSDGCYILSTNSRNDISIWSMETGVKITNVFRHPPTSIITSVVANDLTKLVTLSDNKILRVWDLEKEETVQQESSQDKDNNCIRNVKFISSKGEQRLAVSKSKVSGDICVWNLSNCKPVRTLKGTQADDVLVVDETRAVLRSMGKLALIDLDEGRLIKKLRVSFPRMMSKSRLERRASSLYKRRNLSLRLQQRSGVNAQVRCTQFTDVAIVGGKYVIVLASNRMILNLVSLDDGELVGKLDSGHKECVETILVSANGNSLICSYKKSPAALWDMESRHVVGWLRVDNAFPKLCQAAVTCDGKYLVDAVKINECAHIVTWNLDIAEVQCKIPIRDATVHAVAASSASEIIVCCLKKLEHRNTVMVYALRSGSQLFSLLCGGREQINNIHLSLDGQRAMTFATGDRTIKLWNVMEGAQIGSFTTDHVISDCALSDDGNQVAMAIHKASSIASLSLVSQATSKEMSVDLNNPYYNPENYGAVFEFINILDWDDNTSHMDNTLAEKQ